jgi:SAM-dependent methyltransferase
MRSEKILKEVDAYYTDKVTKFGTTPKGVDWNGEESQYLRFKQLTKIIATDQFSLLDYGCGYGSMYNFLVQHSYSFEYHGYDISSKMIEEAKMLNLKNARWSSNLEDRSDMYNYVVASGIFNVKLENTKEEWFEYILGVLNNINMLSKDAFSFNMLTSYSDKPLMKEYLYYADPCFFFDYCKKNFSRHVSLLHDYGLYEFTITVKK